jgi:hypothetical protein
MVEGILRQTGKKTWYKWSLYINIILFFIVALSIYLLIEDSIKLGEVGGPQWKLVARDIAFLAVALALIFFQFFRNLFTMMRRL